MGLYLVTPLPYNADFSMTNDLRQMLDTLQRKQPSVLQWNLAEERERLERRRRHSFDVPLP
jgi:hypothetical protein